MELRLRKDVRRPRLQGYRNPNIRPSGTNQTVDPQNSENWKMKRFQNQTSRMELVPKRAIAKSVPRVRQYLN